MDIKIIIAVLALLVLGVMAYFWFDLGYQKKGNELPTISDNKDLLHETHDSVAYLAGGCFWCVEKDHEKLDGG